MLLMIKAGIRGGISQAIHKYAKANNKYMKNYNKNIASSYLMYLDANNLYGRAMCKKLPVSNFKWSDDLSVYTENFIKDYDERSGKGCILEVDIKYPNHLWHFILFTILRLTIFSRKEKINKVEKLVANIEDKEKHVIHISAIKQALNHGLILKKVHRVIEFRQEA